jgi:hypothetical protein
MSKYLAILSIDASILRVSSEAWEMVCRCRTFSTDEYNELHRRLREAATAGTPEDLRFDRKAFEQLRGFFFPRLSSKRIDESTAELLLELDLAGKDKEGHICGYSVTALMVIALKAEIAAGITKQQITDDKSTYSAYCRLISKGGLGGNELPLNGGEKLLSVALESISLQNITLRQLIAYRKRELKEPGLGALRRAFAENLTKFLLENANQKNLTQADWQEIQRIYRLRVSDDIRVLSREMACETSAFALSKSILAPILMGVGTLSSLFLAHVSPTIAVAAGAVASVTATQAVLSIAEVVSEGRKTINSQAKILESHPLAYMYELSESV